MPEHPDEYSAEILLDNDGRQFIRYRAPFSDPRQLIDPTLWPRLFSSANSSHISAAILNQRDGGKQLFWAECSGVSELLKGKRLARAYVRLESDLVVSPDGTHLPERWIRITASGARHGAAADARNLVDMLNISGVDSLIPISVYAVHPSFDVPEQDVQILLDSWL